MITIESAYRAESAGDSVRSRAVRLFLAGRSPCEIAAVLQRTTTPASVRMHLRSVGLGGIAWCPLCRRLDET